MMSKKDVRQLAALAKQHGRIVHVRTDPKYPTHKLLLIDGFTYDDANLALAELMDLQASPA